MAGAKYRSRPHPRQERAIPRRGVVRSGDLDSSFCMSFYLFQRDLRHASGHAHVVTGRPACRCPGQSEVENSLRVLALRQCLTIFLVMEVVVAESGRLSSHQPPKNLVAIVIGLLCPGFSHLYDETNLIRTMAKCSFDLPSLAGSWGATDPTTGTYAAISRSRCDRTRPSTTKTLRRVAKVHDLAVFSSSHVAFELSTMTLLVPVSTAVPCQPEDA